MFTQNPGSDFIQHLGSVEQIAKLERMDAALREHGGGEELTNRLGILMSQIRSLRDADQKGLTRLREDYVRLFRGISSNYGPPPPYESVYRSETMMSEHASEVRAIYREAGLEIQGTEPPDHIGFELAFMGYLCGKEEKHREDGDLRMARSLASLQDDFLYNHILKWVPQFCRNILRYESPLYGAVASLTISWLDIEERHVDERKPGSP
ncbi:MAG: hypothetical protein A3K60_04285 [Euryarchaeota archaeon RBG_19FT_COMBO_56_21]|nr:MAG: hypothetical protein A3K60_04285 [Euryarchaeota archaeon RBG_19FT_COMBO_56_21]